MKAGRVAAEAKARRQVNPDPNSKPCSLGKRLRTASQLLCELRKPDFQAAGLYVKKRYADSGFLAAWCRFFVWALHQIWVVIPRAMQHLTVAPNVSRTPMWLTDSNPLENHPWANQPDAMLPDEADVVVIGAGFTGGATTYHWSQKAPTHRRLVILDMADPATGSSGRNEGLVVMGRYFKMVRETVEEHLASVRQDLSDNERQQLANQFAERYCHAAYRNSDLIEQTIHQEQIDCQFHRAGWIQARTANEQAALSESVQMASEFDCPDWTTMTPEEVREKSGMQVEHNAGFSIAAASWHPAKWVWGLLEAAVRRPHVKLFTRTQVTKIDDQGEYYSVTTSRGTLRARHIVYATEAYTPKLLNQFHDRILPMQEQAASGQGGPDTMKEHIGISGSWFFAGRYGRRVLFGSGGSRIPDQEAGRNWPSRFLTKFDAAELLRHFGPYQLEMTNEWSGTVGYTPDEYPIVGTIDKKRQYIIAGMCGSGSGVSFNAARCIVNRILELTDEVDDYPAEYFGPSRILDPTNHDWPGVQETAGE